ncbi:uncharacterized protein LOC121690183 [Alosa sapidissima]|uniref:uncharacterized protein LOC121690183 n=1 Tax=Alosa sapidissima TaxID=34773 RepID=UPI001C09F207|nr:uncharacterized protein LOC121690183 [Alosa sapidissima]
MALSGTSSVSHVSHSLTSGWRKHTIVSCCYANVSLSLRFDTEGNPSLTSERKKDQSRSENRREASAQRYAFHHEAQRGTSAGQALDDLERQPKPDIKPKPVTVALYIAYRFIYNLRYLLLNNPLLVSLYSSRYSQGSQGAIRKCPVTAQATDTDIHQCTIRWFALAHDREGGRSNQREEQEEASYILDFMFFVHVLNGGGRSKRQRDERSQLNLGLIVLCSCHVLNKDFF